jgi:SAM-dependent methyltransferase
MPAPCIICHNSENNHAIIVKELQLGLPEEFAYQRCGKCGSMQLDQFPEDFGKYYPNEDYYSFNLGLTVSKKPDVLRQLKASYLLYGKNPLLGSLLSLGYNPPDHYDWMKKTKAQTGDAILDVGCGNGSLLTKLFQMGFTNLAGIDPFINDSKDYGPIHIKKQDIFETNGSFDVIMMHHSLEHMFNPLHVLKKAYSLLKRGKFLLLRIPVMGNYGWNKYGTYWCGIDAPRHIFIPSEQGIKLLAEQAGFEIKTFEYDSSDYVIWSSEQYLKGIPLHAANSRMTNPKHDVFSDAEIDDFKAIIKKENEKGNGDTAAIYLYKP